MSTKKPSEHRRRTPRNIQGPSLTQQNMKEETDINNIVKRYLPTGALPSHGRPPMYGDFTSIEFQAMQDAIADIDMQFASLPARLRGRFQNDPRQLIRFIEKPENQKEAVRLGLLLDPSTAFGQVDNETGLENDQTDLMSQAEISEALDPLNPKHNPQVVADIQAAAQGGDQEAQLLLDAQRAKTAARKAAKTRITTPPEGD